MDSWLKVAGNFGYGKFVLRQDQMEEISFEPDYHWGGSVYIGPFSLIPDRINISGVISGEWFNPYSKNQISQSTGLAEWNENKEYILEHIKGGVGLNLTFRTKTFDFFCRTVSYRSRVSVKPFSYFGKK